MTRTLLAGVAAMTAFAGAAPALALPAGPPTTDTFNIGGTVDAVCSGSGLATTPLTLNTNLADANGFVNDTAYANQSVTTAEVYCNGVNTSAAVTHVNLTDNTAPSGLQAPFTNVVTFVPQVKIGATTITGDNSATVGLFDGGVTVTLLSGGPANTNHRPVAGAYAGSVSVTFTPVS